MAAMLATQGYAVVATDYLGYAKSNYSFHPYLHADSEATAVIDSVRAARGAASVVGANLSGKVMFTGYSQGGHSSMAAQRAAERDHGNEFNVVGGAHLAGPYSLSGSIKAPDAIAGFQIFVPFMITSWQKVWGDVYTDVKTVFKAPYASYIENLMPNATMGSGALIASGMLPGGTPNQARDAMFQPDYLLGAQTSNTHPFYLAAKKNDLLGWTPKGRVLLCGGAGDPTVPPAQHQAVMKADFDARGVTNVSSVDVDAFVQAAFGPGGKAPTDPTSAAFATYYGNYHGVYEPPFCLAQARAAFDAVK
jgi:pimeloyl-ACP methyl ester carboxylesterase